MPIKTLNAYTNTVIFIEDPVVKMTSTGKNSMKVVLRVVFSAMYICVLAVRLCKRIRIGYNYCAYAVYINFIIAVVGKHDENRERNTSVQVGWLP